MEHRDDVEQFAVAQRVVHQVVARPRPQCRRVPAQFLGEFGDRQHRAIGDMPRYARLLRTEQRRAHPRPQPVGADQRRALDFPTTLHKCCDAIALLGHPGHRAGGLQGDFRRRAAGVQKRRVQIGAVGDRVSVAEALAKIAGQRHAGDFRAAMAVHHDEILDEHRLVGNPFAQAEPVEHAEDIGAELDAGADFAEARRLFEDARGHPLARQRQRRGQPADAAADDEDFARRHDADFPPRVGPGNSS